VKVGLGVGKAVWLYELVWWLVLLVAWEFLGDHDK
jgi:hypothetical protein